MNDLTISKINELATLAATDKKAFNQLYDYITPKISSYIYSRVLNEDLTKEIVANSTFKIFKGLDRFDPSRANFNTWAYKIATNEKVFIEELTDEEIEEMFGEIDFDIQGEDAVSMIIDGEGNIVEEEVVSIDSGAFSLMDALRNSADQNSRKEIFEREVGSVDAKAEKVEWNSKEVYALQFSSEYAESTIYVNTDTYQIVGMEDKVKGFGEDLTFTMEIVAESYSDDGSDINADGLVSVE